MDKKDNKRFPGCPPSLGDILGRSANGGFLYFANQNQRILSLFPRVVGPKDSQHMEAYGYFMGTIHVRTASPAYMERFNYMKRDWIKALNVEMGVPIINDMRIRVLPRGGPAGEIPEDADYKRLSRGLSRKPWDEEG